MNSLPSEAIQLRWGSVDDYLRHPIGAAAQSGGVAVWWPIPGVRLLELRSPIRLSDVSLIEAMLTADASPTAPPHAALTDARRLYEVPEALGSIPGKVESLLDQLTPVITRAATVHTHLAATVTLAAYHRLASVPYETKAFEEGVAALEWLGTSPADAINLWRIWDEALLQRVQAHLDLQLREVLARDLGSANPSRCAKALGMSVRSLQRGLSALRLTFRQLLLEERVRRAQQLLLPKAKLLAVAKEVGFSKPEQLNAAFLKVTGKSATAWRTEREGDS